MVCRSMSPVFHRHHEFPRAPSAKAELCLNPTSISRNSSNNSAGSFRSGVTTCSFPPAIARGVLDKTATLAVAQRCGIRTPRTALVSRSSELHDLVGSFSFPWILKPAQKETRVEELKSCKLASVDEIATRFPLERGFTPPMLVQEYCAGTGVGVEMLLDHGECVAVFQHRRLKELPYTGGFSVIAVAEAPDPSLIESSLALLQAMQWDGIAMVEYKVNSDGQAVLMEVNGRYWGTIALAISAGIDFPLYDWQLVHGER